MKYKLLFCFLFVSVVVMGQNMADGEKFFNTGKYGAAREVYAALLKKKPTDPLTNYRYARTCFELKDYDAAVLHFQKANDRYPMRHFYMGECYFHLYRFDDAVAAYKAYIPLLKNDLLKTEKTNKKIRCAELAGNMLGRVEDIAIVDSFSVNKSDFLEHYKFNPELGFLKQQIIINADSSFFDKVSYITQREDRMYFSDVNNDGNLNLYTSYRLLDGWSEPVPLSEQINTKANENYPFLMLDGLTLYFASDGGNSIGGYDLFLTRFTPTTDDYLTPENIGMPFNSPYNDYMMVVDEQLGVGWFASDRYQPADKVMVYIFIPNENTTILHSEDEEYIRDAARLKVFRHAEMPVAKTINDTESVENKKNEIYFPVYDSLIYTHPDEFRSPDARKMWDVLHDAREALEKDKEQLNTLRTEYGSTTNADVLSELTPEILKLEQNIRSKGAAIEEMTVRIRNREIKYIKENL